MDISDEHFQHVAASSHGPGSHALLPLNYMHSLQTADMTHSPLMPNHTITQPTLILRSPSLGDHKTAVDHYGANYRAATSMSSPGLSFSAANTNISPNYLGVDHFPGLCKATFDYAFNQIYDDQLQFFDISGNDPLENVHSTGQSVEYTNKSTQHETAKTPEELNSTTEKITTCAISSQAAQLSRGGDALKAEPDVDTFTSLSTHRSRASGYPFASKASFLHSLVDMESLKEETYNNDSRRGADFEHETHMASTSTPADYHNQHLLDFSNFPSFPTLDMVSSHRSHKGDALHTINENRPASSNHNVSCSHGAAGAESTPGVGGRGKVQAAPKRRKSQQKRIVCVPATGGVERPTGECLPSDSWAWRKYGQKPIKNSPYPRSYYKCSSVKGCTARKQVERNPSDPMMIIITYTVEHSHPAPTSSSCTTTTTSIRTVVAEADRDQPLLKQPTDASAEANGRLDDKRIINAVDDTHVTMMSSGIRPHNNIIMVSVDGTDAMSEESCEPTAISSEGNLNDASNEEVMQISQQTSTSHDYQHAKVDQEQQYYKHSDHHDNIIHDDDAGLSASANSSSYIHFAGNGLKRSKADDDFFAQLGELPDLFGKSSVIWPHDHQSAAAGTIPIVSTHINIDPFDLYYWP